MIGSHRAQGNRKADLSLAVNSCPTLIHLASRYTRPPGFLSTTRHSLALEYSLASRYTQPPGYLGTAHHSLGLGYSLASRYNQPPDYLSTRGNSALRYNQSPSHLKTTCHSLTPGQISDTLNPQVILEPHATPLLGSILVLRYILIPR